MVFVVKPQRALIFHLPEREEQCSISPLGTPFWVPMSHFFFYGWSRTSYRDGSGVTWVHVRAPCSYLMRWISCTRESSMQSSRSWITTSRLMACLTGRPSSSFSGQWEAFLEWECTKPFIFPGLEWGAEDKCASLAKVTCRLLPGLLVSAWHRAGAGGNEWRKLFLKIGSFATYTCHLWGL